MADLSDITLYLEGAITAAVYPNGTGQPSVAAMDVRIMEGWPIPDQLDRDMNGTTLSGTPAVPVPRLNGPVSNISIYPMHGSNSQVYQIQDHTFTISQPAFGLAVSVVNGVINVSGTPNAGEYLTVIADRAYAYSASGGSASAVIASLAASFSANYSGVGSTASTLTVPAAFSLVVRQGGIGVLGKVLHRQQQSIMVSVWSPNYRARTLLAAAIDVALKAKIVATMPDTSQALIVYNRTNVTDDRQMTTIYRRDLIYDVEYATVQQFPGYVITTVNESIANYDNSAIVPAIT